LDYFRPDCESPARYDTLGERRTIRNLTITTRYVKSFTKGFWRASHTPVEAVNKSRNWGLYGVSREFLSVVGQEVGAACSMILSTGLPPKSSKGKYTRCVFESTATVWP
jgi:hypothetical protein